MKLNPKNLVNVVKKTVKNNMKCKICENKDLLKEYTVREMMFGFRDEFSLFRM